jgi:beta-lactam-binding protein with PASTA domain
MPPELNLIEVPDLEGLMRDNAVRALERRGLTAIVSTMPSIAQAIGTVVGQDPAAGTRVNRGSQVNVSVGRRGL